MSAKFSWGLVGFAVLLLYGCGGSGSSGGSSGGGTPESGSTVSRPSSAFAKSVLPLPDTDCPYGGILVKTGIDVNGNGVLDESEVDTAHLEKVCNGAPGIKVQVTVTEVALGDATQCSGNGGYKVDVWSDINANGKQDSGELSTHNLCNGAKGGTGGNGADGITPVVTMTPVLTSDSVNCSGKGGVRWDVWTDNNPANAQKESGEVATSYVCNGAKGGDGTNGVTPQVSFTLVEVGDQSKCSGWGGGTYEVWTDANRDTVKGSDEVITQTVCNGAKGATGGNGADGISSTVTMTVVAGGDQSYCGGLGGAVIKVTPDTSQPDVFTTQPVCNGAGAMVNLTPLAITETDRCPNGNGGTLFDVGIDRNGNGALDLGEFQTFPLCNAAAAPGTLLAADWDGHLYSLNLSNGKATLVLATYDAGNGCGEALVARMNPATILFGGGASVGRISSMAYRASDHALFAGTGGGAYNNPGSIYRIDLRTGMATFLVNIGNAVPGMTIGPDGTLYAAYKASGYAGLGIVDPTACGTGATTMDRGRGLNSGNGLTFDGDGLSLYLADDTGLHEMDPMLGVALSDVEILYTGFPGDLDYPRISSMTVDPRSGQAYGLLTVDAVYPFGCDPCNGIWATFLVKIDLETAEVTNLGKTLDGLDGLVFIPNARLPAKQYEVSAIEFAPEPPTTGDDFQYTGVSSQYEFSGALPIGFRFQFFGKTYTNFYICAQGFITFDPTADCNDAGALGPGSPNNLIALAWGQLNFQQGSAVTYETLGTAPNRKLVVNFRGVGGGETLDLTAQAMLYEGSNVIELHTTVLDDCCGLSYVQAVENAAGTVAAYYMDRSYISDGSFPLINDAVRFVPIPSTPGNGPVGLTYLIETMPNASGNDANVELSVYGDANENTWLAGDGPGESMPYYSWSTVNVRSGETIYIKVRDLTGNDSHYGIRITATGMLAGSSVGTSAITDAYDPGDDTSAAGTLLLLDTIQDHGLSDGDEDWFVFTAP